MIFTANIWGSVSELPIRQKTFLNCYCFLLHFSELPIRQKTCSENVPSFSRFSELPIRQKTLYCTRV